MTSDTRAAAGIRDILMQNSMGLSPATRHELDAACDALDATVRELRDRNERLKAIVDNFGLCEDCQEPYRMGPVDDGPFAYCGCGRCSEWTGAPPKIDEMEQRVRELGEACSVAVQTIEQLIPEESARGVADVVLFQLRRAARLAKPAAAEGGG